MLEWLEVLVVAIVVVVGLVVIVVIVVVVENSAIASTLLAHKPVSTGSK